MSTPPVSSSEPHDDEFGNADRAWYDRLTGRSPADPDTHKDAIAQADALRNAYQQREQRLSHDVELQRILSPERQEQQLQALFANLRRDGVLPPDAGARPRWRRWAPLMSLAAAASFTAVLVVPMLIEQDAHYPEPTVFRGAEAPLQRQESDPLQAARGLATRLQSAGAEVRIFQSGKTFIIEVDVPDAAPAALVEALNQDGLKSEPGLQRIEIAPR